MVIDFSGESENFFSYDPLNFIRQGGDDTIIQNVEGLVEAIIPIPKSAREKFWMLSARRCLIGGILYYINMDGMDFNKMMTAIQSTPLSSLISQIKSSNNAVAKMYINQLSSATDLSDNKMLLGIGEELSNSITKFAVNPTIRRVFSSENADVVWEYLDDYNILLRAPEEKIKQYSPAIRLIVTQLINFLKRLPNKYGSNDKSSQQMLMLLDEFAALGKIEVMANAVSTLRNKGVNIAIVVQSIAQIDMHYGELERRVLCDNFPFKLILQANDAETQKYASDLAGSREVEKVSKTATTDPLTKDIVS
ncbi:MAG: type IV secretory system conjugative DNA transfer family protein [Oscillospiraceae bacterium]|nr:type IV secretory system conjugative DNA transfer family protein [Oscillospiraceae bacterium]